MWNENREVVKMFHKFHKKQKCNRENHKPDGVRVAEYSARQKKDSPVLSYSGVSVCYGKTMVLSEISFSVRPGEILGIVGESGSGKSTIVRVALGILRPGGAVTGGKICLQGEDISVLREREMQKRRGEEISMIFQDTRASLCPIRTIGDQIYESVTAHGTVSRTEVEKQVLELFERLGLSRGREILASYPFELSGGMNQRIGIAMSMLLRPSVLMADEPTSALDVIAQKKVMEELLKLRDMYHTSIVLVTHNIGVVSAMADTVLVLHNGQIAEYGPAAQVFRHPQDAYTKELLAAVPRLRRNR